MKIETFLQKIFSHAKPAILVVGAKADNVRIEAALYDSRHAPVGFRQFGLHEVTGHVSIQNAVGGNPKGTSVVHFKSDSTPPAYSHILTLDEARIQVQGHFDGVPKESLKDAKPHVIRFTGIRVDTSGQSLDALTVPPHVIYALEGIDRNGTVHYKPTELFAYDLSLMVGGK